MLPITTLIPFGKYVPGRHQGIPLLVSVTRSFSCQKQCVFAARSRDKASIFLAWHHNQGCFNHEMLIENCGASCPNQKSPFCHQTSASTSPTAACAASRYDGLFSWVICGPLRFPLCDIIIRQNLRLFVHKIFVFLRRRYLQAYYSTILLKNWIGDIARFENKNVAVCQKRPT